MFLQRYESVVENGLKQCQHAYVHACMCMDSRLCKYNDVLSQLQYYWYNTIIVYQVHLPLSLCSETVVKFVDTVALHTLLVVQNAFSISTYEVPLCRFESRYWVIFTLIQYGVLCVLEW